MDNYTKDSLNRTVRRCERLLSDLGIERDDQFYTHYCNLLAFDKIEDRAQRFRAMAIESLRCAAWMLADNGKFHDDYRVAFRAYRSYREESGRAQALGVSMTDLMDYEHCVEQRLEELIGDRDNAPGYAS